MSVSLLDVNINELNSPGKLSGYILQLPFYKSFFGNENKVTPKNIHSDDLQDIIMCDQLAKFILEQQLTGRFFMNDFIKPEFDHMMRLSSIPETYEFDWIWTAITHATRADHDHKIEVLQWIDSNWDKLQFQTQRP
eukprot:345631_1